MNPRGYGHPYYEQDEHVDEWGDRVLPSVHGGGQWNPPAPPAASIEERIEARLATLDAEELRDVARHLAHHHAYAVDDAIDAAKWHRAHPQLCAPQTVAAGTRGPAAATTTAVAS